MKDETIEIFNYLINRLNRPVLTSKKFPSQILSGDQLNITIQPVFKQLAKLEELVQDEAGMSELITFSEKLKYFKATPLLFYELLKRRLIGVVNFDPSGIHDINDYGVYHARISEVKFGVDFNIAFAKIEKFKPLENTTNVNYRKFMGVERKIDESVVNVENVTRLVEEKELKDGSNIERCTVIMPNGKSVVYDIGETYKINIHGISRLGDKYVSLFTRNFGKTTYGRDARLKIVYNENPTDSITFPLEMEVKIKRILIVGGRVLMKAYPVDEKELYGQRKR